MAISTLELTRMRQSVCPHCGHQVGSQNRASWIKTGLGILTAFALAMLLMPMGIMTWKACTNFLSNRGSHSILFHPLEDWTVY